MDGRQILNPKEQQERRKAANLIGCKEEQLFYKEVYITALRRRVKAYCYGGKCYVSETGQMFQAYPVD